MVFIFTLLVFINQVLAATAGPVVFGYLPTWQLDRADQVDFSKYTHINIAFAQPDAKGEITMDNRDQVLKEWSSTSDKLLHAKVLVSMGGWTGSKHFSPLLKDENKRSYMIDQMVDWVKSYDLDGWDIDFEYPGRQGDVCHPFDARVDTSNFLRFLGDLRTRMDSEFGKGQKIIALATRFQPFDGPDGSPMPDVSAFAQYVDYFNLMLYDFNGIWSDTTGPNAPLEFEQGKSLQFSFKSSIDAWVDAGIPANKINPGLAFYGRSVIPGRDMSDSVSMYQPLNNTMVPKGDGDDKEESDPSCGGPKIFSGIWKYANMRSEGVLESPEEAAEPWLRRFDDKTRTPWLYSPESNLFISYDDVKSIKAKTQAALAKGTAGVMVWPVTNDFESELVGAILSAF